MTEFALIAPVLFALVFGVFDLGRGMSANVTVTNSAREAARFLVTHTTSWQAPVGGLSTTQGRFDQGCYGTTASPTAPPSNTAQGAAWRQLQNAGLDLSAVTIVVRYYTANPNNDPANGGTANATFTCSSSTGTMTESDPSGTYNPTSGDWVQVEVRYHYSPSTPIISNLIHSVSLDQTTTMVIE